MFNVITPSKNYDFSDTRFNRFKIQNSISLHVYGIAKFTLVDFRNQKIYTVSIITIYCNLQSAK